MRGKTKHISSLIKQEVARIDQHAEKNLYGSRARGNERPDSDWDIIF
ncbi:MAG: nucleotidyltransferase domain-containing protein [Bacteroidetes bacterium]|nr:nucleotidyltransferase domain-containing protein [Bacteroidota bacterium]